MIAKCPRCGKKTEYQQNPFRPFCSERCKLIDLGSWISGSYRITGTDAPEEENETAPPTKDPNKE
jgi:endogenous inhibitor of DNA gyrase (YacG/DUF329 family)